MAQVQKKKATDLGNDISLIFILIVTRVLSNVSVVNTVMTQVPTAAITSGNKRVVCTVLTKNARHSAQLSKQFTNKLHPSHSCIVICL